MGNQTKIHESRKSILRQTYSKKIKT